MKEITIMGEKWTIKELEDGEDDRIIGRLGFCDKSTREIGIMKLGEREEGDIKDRNNLIRHTLRHEIIHALISECGIDEYIDWAANEEVVDFFAYQYPKFNKLFTKLDI